MCVYVLYFSFAPIDSYIFCFVSISIPLFLLSCFVTLCIRCNFVWGLFKNRFAAYSLHWPMQLIQHWSSVKWRDLEVHQTFRKHTQTQQQQRHNSTEHFNACLMRVLTFSIFVYFFDYFYYFHLILFLIFYVRIKNHTQTHTHTYTSEIHEIFRNDQVQ